MLQRALLCSEVCLGDIKFFVVMIHRLIEYALMDDLTHKAMI